MVRRRFIATVATGTVCTHLPGFSVAEPPKVYQRANTDWLAKCRYGIGVHWTAQTVPMKEQPLPFQKAVEAFDVKRFVDALVYAGAEYLLFTAAHALQKLPAPHPVLDKILPGRTCRRDLLAELADGPGVGRATAPAANGGAAAGNGTVGDRQRPRARANETDIKSGDA